MQESNFDFEEGEVLLVDKPLGWTSFDVVKKLRYAGKIKKIGHAGTLDPLATGLMVLCTGKKTKLLGQLTDDDKEYDGSLMLGATTPSYDLETEIVPGGPWEQLQASQLHQAVQQLTGPLQQLPPMHSAVSVGGKRLYELARKGQSIELQPRSIVVHSFQITEIALPKLSFLVHCSKGTYIRSLVHDLGQLLGCGAYLHSLRRTRSGNHSLAQALPLPAWVQLLQQHHASQKKQAE